MQNQNQPRLGRTRFPALGAGCVYLLRVLIGSFGYLLFVIDWLAIVIALVLVLVLVLRHSFENRALRGSYAIHALDKINMDRNISNFGFWIYCTPPFCWLTYPSVLCRFTNQPTYLWLYWAAAQWLQRTRHQRRAQAPRHYSPGYGTGTQSSPVIFQPCEMWWDHWRQWQSCTKNNNKESV